MPSRDSVGGRVRDEISKWEQHFEKTHPKKHSPRRKSQHKPHIHSPVLHPRVLSSLHEQPEIEISLSVDATQEREICTICWDPTTESSRYTLSCGHEFCIGCLSELIRIKVLVDQSDSVQCVWESCSQEISDQDILNLSSDSILNSLQKNRHLQNLLRNPHTRFCPKPTCSALITNANPENPQVNCHACQSSFCFFCLRSWHGAEVSCSEFRETLELKGELESDPLELFENYKKQSNVKCCPRCSVPICKFFGCNHMTCSACKYEFCWLCLGLYDAHHFSQGKCSLYASENARIIAQNNRPEDYPTHYPEVSSSNSTQKTRSQTRKSSRYQANPLKGRVVLPKFFTRIKRRIMNRSSIPPSSNIPVHDSSELPIVLLGVSGVGKSSICYQFARNVWVGDRYDPTVEDSLRKQFVIDDRVYMLDITDTAGLEEFASLRDQWIKHAQGFLFVFRVNMRSSLNSLHDLVRAVERIKEKPIKEIPSVVVGNAWESDFHEIPLDDAIEFSNNYGIPLITCSALNSANLDKVFTDLGRKMIRTPW